MDKEIRCTQCCWAWHRHVAENGLNCGAVPFARDLCLNNNQLSGTLPSAISAMTALQSIQLQGNQLNGALPNSLSVLTKVSYLILSGNPFSSTLPSMIGRLTLLM